MRHQYFKEGKELYRFTYAFTREEVFTHGVFAGSFSEAFSIAVEALREEHGEDVMDRLVGVSLVEVQNEQHLH